MNEKFIRREQIIGEDLAGVRWQDVTPFSEPGAGRNELSFRVKAVALRGRIFEAGERLLLRYEAEEDAPQIIEVVRMEENGSMVFKVIEVKEADENVEK